MLTVFINCALVGAGLFAGAWSFYIIIASFEKAAFAIIGRIKSHRRHHTEH